MQKHRILGFYGGYRVPVVLWAKINCGNGQNIQNIFAYIKFVLPLTNRYVNSKNKKICSNRNKYLERAMAHLSTESFIN